MGITREIETEVTIVGAGPAGLSAAYEIAKAGGEVTIFDENERPAVSCLNRYISFLDLPDMAQVFVESILEVNCWQIVKRLA